LLRNYGYYYLAINDKARALDSFREAVLLDYKLEKELKKLINELENK
jgi:hypothetical protein